MGYAARRSGRLISIVGLGAIVTAAIASSTVLVARTLMAVAASVLAGVGEGLVIALYWMMIQEVAVAALILITRGPVLTLAWIGSRLMAWQGQ
jgi:hypothetical protein